MARIRTIHPGLYTDEAFASLSMAARILIIGIWSHADDGGGFEWKPLTLKMRVFPADMLDVAPLLEELVQNDVVMKYDVDGKTYGAVRNFGRWQRPKKPSRFVPMPEAVRNYAFTNDDEKGTGSEPVKNDEPSDAPKSETSSEPVPNQSGNSESEGRKVGRKEGNIPITTFEDAAHAGVERRSVAKTCADMASSQHQIAIPAQAASGKEPLDARDEAWTRSVDTLERLTGKTKPQAKSLIGRWLRDCRDDCAALNAIIATAAEQRPVDPVSWITASVRARSGTAGRRKSFEETWSNVPDFEDEAR